MKLSPSTGADGPKNLDWRVCIAPMMDWTDRHDRYFLRLISGRARLYTEMVTSAAVLHGNRNRLLGFHAAEHPVALQLGGSEPADMAEAARRGAEAGFDEINMNVGCPSDRVQRGRFGACLMREPNTVAACVASVRAAVDLPVTVKTRIGVDDLDGYDHLRRFVDAIGAAGCDVLVVHARKAWLKGLSPKENREVPPLHYETVYRLKQDFPQLPIVINGGITDLQAADDHLAKVDGVMLGRAAYQTPYLLAAIDRRFFDPGAPVPDRETIVAGIRRYAADQVAGGVPLPAITRHILGLYQGRPGARGWRRHLTEAGRRPGAGVEVIDEALDIVRRAADRAEARLAA